MYSRSVSSFCVELSSCRVGGCRLRPPPKIGIFFIFEKKFGYFSKKKSKKILKIIFAFFRFLSIFEKKFFVTVFFPKNRQK